MLKEFDIFIKDLKVSYEEKEMDTNMVNMFVPPVAKAAGTPMVSDVKIELIHEVVDKNNNKFNIGMGLESESEGTRILFSLAPFLKYAFEENKVIVIDELEKSLHPAIVEYIIKMFNNKKINKSNSQLIFTTHATNLLSLEEIKYGSQKKIQKLLPQIYIHLIRSQLEKMKIYKKVI